MDKISHATATPAREFTAGNPQLAIRATRVTAKWLNAIQREIVAAVEDSGQTLSDLDDAQLTKALRGLANSAAHRQTVIYGRLNAAGQPEILAALSGLDFQVLGATTPAVFAFGAGVDARGLVDRFGSISTNLTITMPANVTRYVYAERNATTGVVTAGLAVQQPVYGPVHPASPATGQHSFLIPLNAMFEWSGSAWVQVQRVFIGVVVSGGASITTIVNHPLRLRPDNPPVNSLLANVYATQSDLFANLNFPENTGAVVVTDTVHANRGLYRKLGASGSGSWTQVNNIIPGYQFVQAANVGAGTPNAIVASSVLHIPSNDGAVSVVMNIVATNTASPVTVTFNGGSARQIKTASGADVPVGGLIAGMIVEGFIAQGGTVFQLTSDIATLALVNQAAGHAAAAQAAANAAVTQSGTLPRLADRAALKAHSTSLSPAYVAEVGRAAMWRWDANVPIAAHQSDPGEWMFIAPNAAAIGAWVRDYPDDPRLAGGARQTAIDIVVMYGQSNGVGRATNTAGVPTVITPLATMWNFGTGAPVALSANMPTALDGTGQGNLAPALANEYCARTGRRVIFVNCCKDSQSVAQLSKGHVSGNYAAMTAAYAAVVAWIAARGYTVGRASMVYYQGEQDILEAASGGLTTLKTAWKTHYDALGVLWTDIKADTGITRQYLNVVGSRRLGSMWPGNAPIQNAQREFARRRSDVVIAADIANKMYVDLGLSDGLHLYQTGLNRVGLAIGRTMADDVLMGDTPASEDDFIEHGRIRVHPFQAYDMASLTMAVAASAPRFNLNNWGNGLAHSFIIASDETTDPNELRLYVAKPATQIINFGAALHINGHATGYSVALGTINKLETDTDHFIPVRFYFSGSARVDTALQTIVGRTGATTYNNAIASLFTTPIAAAAPVWGTGTVTLRHPVKEALPGAVVSSGTNRMLRVNQSNTTTTAIAMADTAGAAQHGIVDLSFRNMLVPLAAVPTGMIFALHALIATYNQ